MDVSHNTEVGLKGNGRDGVRSCRQCSGGITARITTLVPCLRQARWSPAAELYVSGQLAGGGTEPRPSGDERFHPGHAVTN